MSSFLASSRLSRRHFLQSASAVALAHSLPAVARAQSAHGYRAYVGCYTGTAGNGEGIYLFDFDAATGALSNRRLVANTPSPSWLAVHPSRKFLYAANEVADFNGASGSASGPKTGSVSAFAIDAATGSLTSLNTVSSKGAEPAYLSLDATGRFAFVANYGVGSIAVLPILPSGALAPAIDIIQDKDSLGATKPTSAPAGSFAFSGHDAPHAHMIAASPDNRFVLATDLGQDRIYIYAFDAATGKLRPAATLFATLPTGDGPRHFAFHPNGQWLYSIQEEASTVVLFHYNAATGALTAQQTVSALPEGFSGTSFASEILVAPNGKTLYAANRLHDTMAVFAIGADGRLTYAGETPTGGDYPVQCRIDPTGRYFFACNRKSDAITTLRIDPATGLLTPTGQFTAVGSPASITFVSV
ncbi:MAG TPA: lactonase family protein [Terracidiphilus sp.]|jgi:6-phosphogluconolactonase (cycloisomerase 2 family)|nr:lactonase family protein [Terracidiphilus sp.]